MLEPKVTADNAEQSFAGHCPIISFHVKFTLFLLSPRTTYMDSLGEDDIELTHLTWRESGACSG